MNFKNRRNAGVGIVLTLLPVSLHLFISWKFGPQKYMLKTPAAFQLEYVTPECQGMSSQRLDWMRKILEEKNTRKLMILRNDKVVYEWFSEGLDDDTRKRGTASLAKALVGGMSLAAAIDDGYLTLNEAACYYIPRSRTILSCGST